ncbi:MAG: hypothetical protein ACP5JH_07940 [Bacteroidota bacterium]
MEFKPEIYPLMVEKMQSAQGGLWRELRVRVSAVFTCLSVLALWATSAQGQVYRGVKWQMTLEQVRKAVPTKTFKYVGMPSRTVTVYYYDDTLSGYPGMVGFYFNEGKLNRIIEAYQKISEVRDKAERVAIAKHVLDVMIRKFGPPQSSSVDEIEQAPFNEALLTPDRVFEATWKKGDTRIRFQYYKSWSLRVYYEPLKESEPRQRGSSPKH